MWDKDRPTLLLSAVLSAVCLGLGLNALILSTELARQDEAFQRVQQLEFSMTPLMGLLRLCILAPLMEELMFRLILCFGGEYVLKRLLPEKAAACVALLSSSFLFAATHGNLVQGLYAFCMGLLMGGYLLKSRILYISFLMHAVANLVVYGLAITGLSSLLYHPLPGLCLCLAGVGIPVLQRFFSLTGQRH